MPGAEVVKDIGLAHLAGTVKQQGHTPRCFVFPFDKLRFDFFRCIRIASLLCIAHHAIAVKSRKISYQHIYWGHLSADENTNYLAPSIQSSLNATLNGMENRMARLLFKLAVEMSMTMHIMAWQLVKQQSYNAAGYCRLSSEDDLSGESSSIATQQELIIQYCKEHGINLFDYYVDDGFSGTNFMTSDKPSYLKREIHDHAGWHTTSNAKAPWMCVSKIQGALLQLRLT